MKKATLKQLETYNTNEKSDLCLFVIDVTFFAKTRNHLTDRGRLLYFKCDSYKRALELYERLKLLKTNDLCRVHLARTYWWQNDIEYKDIFTWTAPKLKELYSMGYYVLYQW